MNKTRTAVRSRSVCVKRIRSRATIRHAKQCTTLSHATQAKTHAQNVGGILVAQIPLWRIASRIRLTPASFNPTYGLKAVETLNPSKVRRWVLRYSTHLRVAALKT
jgi:hypothetical protein